MRQILLTARPVKGLDSPIDAVGRWPKGARIQLLAKGYCACLGKRMSHKGGVDELQVIKLGRPAASMGPILRSCEQDHPASHKSINDPAVYGYHRRLQA